MLQAMAFGGNLGTSLFRQVSACETPSSLISSCVSRLGLSWADAMLGNRCIPVSASTVELRGLRSLAVILRLRASCGLLPRATAE